MIGVICLDGFLATGSRIGVRDDGYGERWSPMLLGPASECGMT